MDKRDRKEQIIKEYIAGGTTTRKLGLKYGYCFGYIAKLVRTYYKDMDKRQRLQASKLSIKEKELIPGDVKQLQEELRMARLEILLLKATIDISDEQFGTDIRKKAGTRPS